MVVYLFGSPCRQSATGVRRMTDRESWLSAALSQDPAGEMYRLISSSRHRATRLNSCQIKGCTTSVHHYSFCKRLCRAAPCPLGFQSNVSSKGRFILHSRRSVALTPFCLIQAFLKITLCHVGSG